MDVPLTILFLMACGFTTHTKGSNSLQLTSSPATASPDQPYTLICSSSGSGRREREWHWRNDIIFRTRYVSDTQCPVDVSNNDLYKHLSRRISVACSYNQYNVTLMILTSIDNGSVWWCGDYPSDRQSNRLTIHADNQVVYIAAGVGGGIAVVIVVVVSVLCIRRRKGRPVNNASAREHKHAASHTYYNENSGLQNQDINDKVLVENDIYESSHDVTSPNQPSTNDHVITDVYAQVQKPKKSMPKPTGTADEINMEDLYAKPDKTKIRKKQED